MPLDNPHELFYLVDEKDHVLGSITRGKAHSGTKKIHRAIVVFIFTPDLTQVLLQQRTLTKDTSPGYWGDSIGGHLEYGQTYKQAALRETQEELGLDHLNLKYHSKHLFDLGIEREYCAIYTARLPQNTPIHFDRDEIQQVRWIPVKDMPQFIQTQKCTPGLIQSWSKVEVRLPV